MLGSGKETSLPAPLYTCLVKCTTPLSHTTTSMPNLCVTSNSTSVTPVSSPCGQFVGYWQPVVVPQPFSMDQSWMTSEMENLCVAESHQSKVVENDCVGTSHVSWERLQGHVWRLSRDPSGCRLIQKALEDARGDSERALIASELRNRVWEALKSPHANHVLQKCISTMRPCDSQFIVDELTHPGPRAAVLAAEHQYGCRILQRLLEHFSSDRLHLLIDNLLAEAISLCNHNYGSFLMQHLLEYGDDYHIKILLNELTQHAAVIAADPCGVTVLSKALLYPGQEQAALANVLAAHPSWLVSMSVWRHGYNSAKISLETAAPHLQRSALKDVLRNHRNLKKSRYGRKLLTFAENLSEDLKEKLP